MEDRYSKDVTGTINGPIMRITQKLSSTWAFKASHSSGVIPSPTAILSRRHSQSRPQKSIMLHVRLHDNEPKSLHLLYPHLVTLSEIRDRRPLVFSPQRLRLVWVLYGFVKVYALMVVGFAIRDVLL